MRHAYTGDPVPRLLPTPLYEGWLDASRTSTRGEHGLYRLSWWKHALWKIGNVARRMLGRPSDA